MRSAALLLALVVAGCGGDGDDGSSGPEPVTAAAFIGCFELEGHEAVKPEHGSESIYSYTLKAEGFSVESVNVQPKGGVVQAAYLSLFEDEDARADATKKVPPKPIAGGPAAYVENNAVVGYLDEEAERETREAIERCLR